MGNDFKNEFYLLLDNEQITKKIKETKGFWRVQKWLIIYNAKNYPCKAEDLAKHLNVSE